MYIPKSGSIQLNVLVTYFVEPTAIADTFAKHLQSVYNNWDPSDFPLLSHSPEFVSITPIFDADVCKPIKRLKPSKSVGLDDIPGFIMKGCSAIFIPVSFLSLTQQYFPAAWKEAAVVPVFKRGNHAVMSNYRHISIINSFF
jgi:hypothetical protein